MLPTGLSDLFLTNVTLIQTVNTNVTLTLPLLSCPRCRRQSFLTIGHVTTEQL